jgi:hypothetical protein
MDDKFGRDPSRFSLTSAYLLPLNKYRGGKNKGCYKLRPDGERVYTCFTSDFFLMDISRYLTGIKHVIVGGESGRDTRICDLQWVIALQRQCKTARVPFWFKQTGARFINEEGGLVKVARMHQQRLAASYRLSFS